MYLRILPRALPMGGIRRRALKDAESESSNTRGASSSASANVPQRRSGVRRRLQEPTPNSPPASAMPPRNKSLLRDWTLGILPSNRVEEYAMNAVARGADGCKPFARVGGQEKHTGNMQRDIMKALGQPSGSCPFYWM